MADQLLKGGLLTQVYRNFDEGAPREGVMSPQDANTPNLRMILTNYSKIRYY